MKISIIISIVIIVFIFIALSIAEFLMVDKEHASVYLDKHKEDICKKFESVKTPLEITTMIHDSIHNQPFIYRQVIFLALFASLLTVNFLYVLIPIMTIEMFFPVFFMMLFVFFIELAFINFHYYQQKEEMVKTGLYHLKKYI